MNHCFQLASIVRQADEKKANFKSLLFNAKSLKGNLKANYASVVKTLKILPKIKEFVKDIQRQEKTTIENLYLFAVQVNEYFNPKARKIGGKLTRLIKKYESVLKSFMP